MASSTLVGTYTRYKAGKRTVSTWLSSNAPRAASLASNASDGKIPVDSLIGLATSIVTAANPRIEIPDYILDAIKDVVKGRKWAAEWYAAKQGAKPSKAEKQKNAGHLYIVRKLEEVYETLRREVKARRPSRKKKIELATDKGDLANVYRHLNLEDTAEESTHLPDDTQPCPCSNKPERPAEVLFDLEDDEDDIAFEIWCLLKDFFEIRKQHREVWQQYNDAKLIYLTASRGSENAFTMVSNMSTDFTNRHPELAHFPDIIKVLGEESYITTARITDWDDPNTWSTAANVTREAGLERAAFQLMAAWCALQDFAHVLEPLVRTPEEVRNGVLVSVYPGHPFAKKLLNIVGEIVQLTKLSKDNPTWRAGGLRRFDAEATEEIFLLGDKYTQALITFAVSRTMSPGVVASTQMMMDVHDILDGDLERGIRECEPFLEEARSTATSFAGWTRQISKCARKTVPNELVEKLHQTSHSFLPGQSRDGQEGWLWSSPHTSGIGHSSFMPLNLVSTLPILVGAGTWQVLASMKDVGLQACNSSQTVLGAAHLQNAARLLGSCAEPWPDMDHVLSRTADGKSLIRQGDGTIRSAAVQYCLALGMKVNQASQKHRPKLPSAQACAAHYVKLEDPTYLSESGYSLTPSDTRYYYEAIKRYAATGPGIQDQVIAEQWASTKRLAPAQLLQVLQDLVLEDEKTILFDYIALFQRCIDFLAAAADELCYQQNRKTIKSIIPPDQLPYEFVHEILQEAAAHQGRRLEPEVSTLHTVGMFFDRVIARYNDSSIKYLNMYSSGSSANGLSPSTPYGQKAMLLPRKVAKPLVHVLQASSFATVRASDMTETSGSLQPDQGKGKERVLSEQEQEDALRRYKAGVRLVSKEEASAIESGGVKAMAGTKAVVLDLAQVKGMDPPPTGERTA